MLEEEYIKVVFAHESLRLLYFDKLTVVVR